MPDQWGELRTLIVGPERERLNKVERKLDDPGLHVDAVAEVLPEAVERRAGDKALGDAMGPIVGEAIKASVRKDPQPIVDAIFPVIGPAIRKAIAAAFSELVQSINTTLEHSFTPRGLAWRFEALRTGKSFGEVVLSHSLLFRAEQLFLIHRHTGLLVRHVTAPGVQALSPDMVAGMLTAITDFARDSFNVSSQEGLNSLALGDLTVWIEQGPAITLAAVVRGHAPAGYREVLQEAVEGVQHRHAADLDRFGETGEPFEVRHDLIEPCLISQLAARPSKGTWRLVAIGALLLAGLGWCAAPRVLERRAVNRYVAQLRQEPGIVVANVTRLGGRYVVNGLRDPLARDPVAFLAGHDLDSARVGGKWEGYVALRPEFIVKRASDALRPPPGVSLVMRGDTLTMSGVAGGAWIASARAAARAVAGVQQVDLSPLQDALDVAMRDTIAAAERLRVNFDRGEAFPRPGFRPAADSLATFLQFLLRTAEIRGRNLVVEVRASTDSAGRDDVNRALRIERARVLRSLLVARDIPARAVVVNADSTGGVRQAYLRITLGPPPAPVP